MGQSAIRQELHTLSSMILTSKWWSWWCVGVCKAGC
jgi:hypothetical protein